jgi:hypothetical protein
MVSSCYRYSMFIKIFFIDLSKKGTTHKLLSCNRQHQHYTGIISHTFLNKCIFYNSLEADEHGI